LLILETSVLQKVNVPQSHTLTCRSSVKSH
jgi:hypothetical protein